MRVVFVTHNELGLACLEELVSLDADIRAIYTRPERDDIADQTKIEIFANKYSLPLHTVESVNTDAVKRQIVGYDPELLFVVGWSRLVDAEILDIPTVAALGMHPAPLPRGRGRAPLAWSIIKGLDETALSFFHLTERADAGDIVSQEPLPIHDEDDATSMYDKMVEAGRKLINQCYPKFEDGHVPKTPQDESSATWWPRRRPHHGRIDWNRSPRAVYDWIRGQTRPYPGAFSYLNGKKITIWSANPPNTGSAFVEPGTIEYKERSVLGIGAWEGIVEITEVQVGDDDSITAGKLLTNYDYELGETFDDARDLR